MFWVTAAVLVWLVELVVANRQGRPAPGFVLPTSLERESSKRRAAEARANAQQARKAKAEARSQRSKWLRSQLTASTPTGTAPLVSD